MKGEKPHDHLNCCRRNIQQNSKSAHDIKKQLEIEENCFNIKYMKTHSEHHSVQFSSVMSTP